MTALSGKGATLLSGKGATLPDHVALIMDGNRRWAQKEGKNKKQGHEAGVDALREIVRCASKVKLKRLTCYGFSLDNWKRSPDEVKDLMTMVRNFLTQDLAELHENKVCLNILGQRQGVEKDILQQIEGAENLTKANAGLHLVIAFNYGSRNEMTGHATRLAAEKALTQDNLEKALSPAVDLLVRTGGEQRLSDFLLWQCAYSELMFLPTFWPDFTPTLFLGCLAEYETRNRRFGADEDAL